VRFVNLGHAAAAGDPGVVHQHVQAAQSLDRRGHQILHVRGRRHVRSHSDRRTAVGVEPVCRRRNRALVQVGQDDRRSLAHEQLGHRQAEPSPRSGDHRALARQAAHSPRVSQCLLIARATNSTHAIILAAAWLIKG